MILCWTSLSLFLFAGCSGAPSVGQVRWEIQRRFPEARFEPEAHIHLGRISLGLIRGIVRMVPGKVEGQEILNEIHSVEVASYKVHGLPNLDRIPSHTGFEERLARDGWSMAVRTREQDSRAWIFFRGDEGGAMRNLFVVALEDDELTMVRVDGRLDRVVAEAIARKPKRAVQTIKGEEAEEEAAEPGGVS